MDLSRRKFWASLAGLAALPAGLVAYMRREAQDYEITHTSIALPQLDEALTVLHLSDFHASKDVSFSQIEQALKQATKAVTPDIICLTGDYMTSEFPDPAAYQSVLAPLAEVAPTFAIMGNHDFTRTDRGSVSFAQMIELLKACNFEVLYNENRQVEIRGQRLDITGVGDIWSGTCRPHSILNKRESAPASRPPRLLLSHNPDSKKQLQAYDWDLMLCGHTHGGQLRIPFTQIRPVLPLADRAFVEGLHAWDGRHIFITRGIGNQHGVRFNCRPEISILHLSPNPV